MQFKTFFRNNVIKPSISLQSIKIEDTESVVLPESSILLHIGSDQGVFGIPTYDPVIANYPNTVRSFLVTDLKFHKGSGRRSNMASNDQKMMTKYFREQPNIQRQRDLDRWPSDKTLVVLDGTPMLSGTTYQETALLSYYKWYNLRKTMIDTVNSIDLSEKDRYVFWYLRLPRSVPTLERLRDKIYDLDTTKMKFWPTAEHLDMRDLFHLRLNQGVYTEIKESHRERIIFMIRNDRKTIFVPYGRLMEDSENGLHLFNAFEKMIEAQSEYEDKKLQDEVGEETTYTDRVSVKLEKIVDSLSKASVISVGEKKRILERSAASMNQKDPLDPSRTIKDLLDKDNDPKEVSEDYIHPVENTTNVHALKSTLPNLKKDYRDQRLHRDVLRTIAAFSNGGVLVENIQVEPYEDAQNLGTVYKAQISLPPGKVSTVHFPIPEIRNDGTFLINGVRYTMDTQKVDAVIRKINEETVVISAYEGRVQIARSALTAHDYFGWLLKKIVVAGLDNSNETVQKMAFGGIPRFKVKVPMVYSRLASRLKSFKTGDYTFDFDFNRTDRKEKYAEYLKFEGDGSVLCGMIGKDALLMDSSNIVYRIPSGGKPEEIGMLETIIGLTGRVPQTHIYIRVFSKRVPLILVMCYLHGFNAVMKLFNLKYTSYPAGTRVASGNKDIVVIFEDQRLHFSDLKIEDKMLLAGFNIVSDDLRTLRLDQMERQSNYVAFNEKLKIASNAWQQVEHQEDFFLDPISKDSLKALGEPTEWMPLLYRCCELLKDDRHPDQTETTYTRLRGVERFPGMIHSIMSSAVRRAKYAGQTKTTRIDINPRELTDMICREETVMLHEMSNPIHGLKEMAAVNLGGRGGQSGDTLVARARVFHQKDIGIFSGDTPDSGNAGVRVFTTANPKVKNNLGIMGEYDPKTDRNASRAFSQVTALYPGGNKDNSVRANMASVQWSATIPTVGYCPWPLQTGEEKTIASKASDEFAFNAKQDGVVEKLTSDQMVIRYKDNTVTSIRVGIVHGSVSGSIIPHPITTDLRIGSKVKKGDVVAWHRDFYSRDFYNPSNVVLHLGTIANVVFMETDQTHEDSSRTSLALANDLATYDTKMYSMAGEYKNVLDTLIKIGTEVDLDTVIAELIPADIYEQVKDSSSEIISGMSKDTIKASTKGVVSKIDFLYIGDKEEMHETVRAVLDKVEAEKRKLYKDAEHREPLSCQINDAFSFAFGKKIESGQFCVAVYVDMEVSMSTGDKLIVGPQLKSVAGGILPPGYTTVKGDIIGAEFSYRAELDRIVTSTTTAGLYVMALQAVSAQFAKTYRGK